MNRIIIFRAYGCSFFIRKGMKKIYIFDRKINGVDTHTANIIVLLMILHFLQLTKKSGDEMDYFCLRHGEALHATTNAS